MSLLWRAKAAEDHTAAARYDAHKQLEVRAAKARATAQRRSEEMKARDAKVNDDLASAWASLRAQVQEQFKTSESPRWNARTRPPGPPPP